MSLVHRVIILNQPLKIFGFAPLQLGLLVVWVIVGLVLAGRFPGEWKFHNVPIGVWFAIFWFCIALVAVKMSEVKPWSWWKNMLTYRLNLVPKTYIPKIEAAQPYPDGNIIELKKSTEKFYVEAE